MSSPRKKAPTKAWYVTLGTGKSGKTQKKPALPGGLFIDSFPITFKVPTEALADEVLLYQDAITVIEAAESVYERVRLAYTLPLGDGLLSRHMEEEGTYGLYPVLHGWESAVFMTHAEAISATKGFYKPIWKKVPSFRRAIAYMVSGAETEKTDGAAELRELLQAHISNSSPPQRAPKQEDEGVTGFASPQRAPPQVAGTPSRRGNEYGRYTSSQAQMSSPMPPTPPSPSPSPSPLCAEPTYHIPDDPAEVGGGIYQHSRDLAGITRSHVFPLINTVKVPSCGPALDMFLQAFGYDTESRFTVADICKNSRNMGEFVKEIAVRACLPMVLLGKGKRLPARLEAIANQRKYVTRLARKPYRVRIKKEIIKKTPAEKKVLAERHVETREKLSGALATARDTIAEEARKLQAEFGGHDHKYYEHQILQSSRIANTTRKTNPWNAFIRFELQKWNNALPKDAKRCSSTDPVFLAMARALWASMSDEEKAQFNEEAMKDLEEAKEMKALSVQSVPINAFHDARATLDGIFKEIQRLHARTGIEIGLVAVRSAKNHHTPAMSFGTSARVHEFIQMSLDTSLDDIAWGLEAYCLSGVSGLLERSVDVIQDLQSRTASLISQRLGDISKGAVKKMIYSGFADRITSRQGLVIEGWPLKAFQAPSSFRTRLELSTLFQAWERKTAHFRKLTEPEWRQWEQQVLGDSAVSIYAVNFAVGVPQGPPPSIDSSTATTAPADPANTENVAPADGLAIPPAAPTDATATASPPQLSATVAAATPGVEEGNARAAGAAKTRKRRSDYGKSHKKRKADALEDARAASMLTPASAPTPTTSATAQVPAPPAHAPAFASALAPTPAHVPVPVPVPAHLPASASVSASTSAPVLANAHATSARLDAHSPPTLPYTHVAPSPAFPHPSLSPSHASGWYTPSGNAAPPPPHAPALAPVSSDMQGAHLAGAFAFPGGYPYGAHPSAFASGSAPTTSGDPYYTHIGGYSFQPPPPPDHAIDPLLMQGGYGGVPIFHPSTNGQPPSLHVQLYPGAGLN
ncbi:uncharacterized protein TRAVEDRAFT_24434 [Trametes versicolor FP-101664 SS1]|uniref:uncharacterized protein n=1 Tax=Trametes versicolor (strain FP-101664) TaxID=717944 RepID=UPI0004622220|nr:uncharacterized protein TRAVEDRAFT_24434 [Trametes versicolor FP-101664 SS1]EIW53125.1 hypothetical protein TRAVEDRAFT_24434 [Trametes versicolor FP-101664 SS1]